VQRLEAGVGVAARGGECLRIAGIGVVLCLCQGLRVARICVVLRLGQGARIACIHLPDIGGVVVVHAVGDVGHADAAAAAGIGTRHRRTGGSVGGCVVGAAEDDLVRIAVAIVVHPGARVLSVLAVLSILAVLAVLAVLAGGTLRASRALRTR